MSRVVIDASLVSDDDVERLLLAIRAFDVTHPGCHFSIKVLDSNHSMSEMYRLLESINLNILFAGKLK